ncbi:MAG: type II secretion system F family protein [Acidimicrobiia bacterium]
MTAATAAAVCFLLLSGRKRLIVAAGVVGAVWLFGVFVAAAILAGGVLVLAWRRAHAKTVDSKQDGVDMSLAIDVVALSVSAGLPFSAAAELGAKTVGGEIGTEITRAMRAPAGRPLDFESRRGPLRSMFESANRSVQTGAPLGPILVALGSDLRAERNAEARLRLSRLPVKLLFPLAFLILPGFVLLAVSPAVIGGLTRLGI